MKAMANIVLMLVCVGCQPSAKKAVDVPVVTRKGSDWPTFLGPKGDGSSSETGVLTTWPAAGLKKLWEAKLGDGYAPPVVADGRLFHFDRFDNNATLTARNAETGEQLWTYAYQSNYVDSYGYDPGPRASPVVDGDRVYIHGVEGMISCVNATNGEEIWKVDTKRKYHFHQNFFGVGSVPVVVGKLLIVPVGGSPKGARPNDLREAKGDGSGLVAFDKLTGVERYKFSDELASYSSPRLAKFHGKSTVLYFARGGLLGFDPDDGRVRLQFPWRAKTLESVNAANPVVIGDRILISECYEKGSVLLKVQPDFKLETIWSDAEADRREKALSSHWCTPIVDGDCIYGCSGRHESEADVRCVSLKTGEVKWTAPRSRRCTFTKIDGHLLCLAEDGTLSLLKLNPDKYEKVAEWNERHNPDLAAPCWAPPVVSHGLIYLRGKGKLICCELCQGK